MPYTRAIVKLMLLFLLVPMRSSSMSVECPVKKTFAYSRQTTSGIPGPKGATGSPDKPLLVSYFIYVVVRKGTVPSVTGVWLEGKYYAATLKRVDSPVEVEQDAAVPTGWMDTLVAKTSDDVYQVDPGAETPWSPKDDAEKGLTQRNQAVVFLAVGHATRYCPVKKIKALRPAMGM